MGRVLEFGRIPRVELEKSVSDPVERITLALKPRPAPEGAAKPAHSAGPTPPGLDPAVWAEVKLAAQTFDYLTLFGEPVEFWEAVRLARSHRGIVVAEDGTADPSSMGNGLAEELQCIRRQLSPMVRDLRRYLLRAADVPKPGEPLEVALGFLLASSREHQAVAKWLAESDKHLVKAASKLRSLIEIANPYLEALRPWSLDGPRTPLGAPPPAEKETVESLAAVPLAHDQLENFRRAFLMRQVFVETDLQVAFWEVLLLNAVERVPCQSRLEQITRAKEAKQLAAFHEEVRLLHGHLLPLRASHGRWVAATESYLKPLPGMLKDPSMFDMTLAFVVVEAGAKDRARRWLTEREACAAEAVAYFLKMARQVKACIAAVKSPAAAASPSK